MANARQKVRLVTVGDIELRYGFLKFLKQAHIFNRDHGLSSESF